MRDRPSIRIDRRAAAGRPPRERRSPGAIAVSVLVNVAVVALFFQALVVHPGALVRLFTSPETPAERLVYADVRAGSGPPAAEPAAGPPPPPRGVPEERPEERPEIAPDAPAPPADERPVAPQATPSALPTPAAGERDGVAGGTGEAGGRGGGATAGLRPTYSDSPIWTRPGDLPRSPLPLADRLDSAVAGDFAALRAAAAAAAEAQASQRQPGDWTMERNGEKYGVDQRFIHLGKVKVPTALLGLLNLTSVQANPVAVERERRLNSMRREIQEQAHRIQTETDVREIIGDIRERKDRERTERRSRVAGSGGG